MKRRDVISERRSASPEPLLKAGHPPQVFRRENGTEGSWVTTMLPHRILENERMSITQLAQWTAQHDPAALLTRWQQLADRLRLAGEKQQ